MQIGNTSKRTYSRAHRAPHCVGIQSQLQKECLEPYANYLVSRLVTELNYVQSASVTQENRQVQSVSGTLPKGPSGALPYVPQTVGADGLTVGSCSIGPVAHEGLSTLGSIPQARPSTSRLSKGESDDGSVHGISNRGGAHGHSAGQEDCDNRRVPLGVGCTRAGQ